MNADLYSERSPFLTGLQVQFRVIGALLMREIHTRYGRENIGYLWLIAEPMILGSVIALLHSGQSSHGGINPVAFTVIGYCIFIIFRGVVNRAEGALESNAPLLYHRMVTIFDISLARALLELAGCVSALVVLLTIVIMLDYTGLPVRPLYLVLGIFYVWWVAFGVSLIITGATYEKPTFGRLVHPFSYFMIPLSGAFYQVGWVPQPYRDWLLWLPLPHMFEIVRYGQFESATLEYVDYVYITAMCMVLTLLGLISVDLSRKRIQLS